MARGLDEVKTSVYAIVDQLLSVHAVFLLKVSIEARLDVFDNWFPAAKSCNVISCALHCERQK
jgi:hypothetical protein